MILTKEDIIAAVAELGSLDTINYISAMPYASYELGKISNSNSAEYNHIRNGGEPWKTKNKRGGR